MKVSFTVSEGQLQSKLSSVSRSVKVSFKISEGRIQGQRRSASRSVNVGFKVSEGQVSILPMLGVEACQLSTVGPCVYGYFWNRVPDSRNGRVSGYPKIDR